jgi:tRNA dimethylallyltransferase
MPEAAAGAPAVPVLLGPTATGKTAIGVELAARWGGEIISADSRAFFRGLDVVTDKPSAAQRRRIPHHLVDHVAVDGRYDAMAFRRDVARLVPQIVGRGAIPLLVGGGTVYLGAVLQGLFEGAARDDGFRARVASVPAKRLHARLAEVDPPAAKAIHRADRLRIVRALEVYATTGKRISTLQSEARPLPFAWNVFGLHLEPGKHREAIATRVERMVNGGLLQEARRLRERGLTDRHQAYRTIGIPEAMACLEGSLDAAAMQAAIVRRTWGLARRQRAWFRRLRAVRWIDVTGREAADVAAELLAMREDRKEGG